MSQGPIPRGRSTEVAVAVSGRSNKPSRRMYVWLAGFLFLCFIFFLPRVDWNENARLDMTLAIVNHHTVAIDAYHANTGDDDRFAGHYYSDKPPGQSLLAVPVYGGYRLLTTLMHAPSAALAPWRRRSVRTRFLLLEYLMSVVTVTVPAVMFLTLFFWFLGNFSASVVNRLVVTLGLALGTSFFPYAQNFYAHDSTAALVFTAFTLAYLATARHGAAGPASRWLQAHQGTTALVTGMCLGVSVLLEYTAAVAAVLVGVYALTRLNRRFWPHLVLGAVPAACVIATYDLAVYHNPFLTGYTGGASLWTHAESQGIAGFTWPPKLSAVQGLTLSPGRGLFAISPFLLLSLPGYVAWLSRRVQAACREPVLFLAIPIAYVLVIAMYWEWSGGWAVGPRYLLPAVPFVAFPVIFVLDRASSVTARAALYSLVAMSVALVWIETMALSFPPDSVANPLRLYSLPSLAHGHIALNLGMFAGPHSLLSFVPLAVFLAMWTLAIAARPLLSSASRSLRSVAAARKAAAT